MTKSWNEIQTAVARVRRFAGRRGCRSCRRVLAQGLFLKGSPSLSALVRGGGDWEGIKKAIRERGWFCRTCVNVRQRLGTAATTSLYGGAPSTRHLYDTEEEYYDALTKRYKQEHPKESPEDTPLLK